jgi:O-antigen ligase
VAGSQETVLQICKMFVVVAIIQSFVGTLQFYDIAFKELPGANAKPFGLMANRNLFGSAQAFVIPFVIFILYKGSRNWRVPSIIALVGLIVSLILSQTRAAWLASLAMVLVALILVMFFSPTNRKKWLIGTAGFLIAVVAIGGLLLVTDSDGILRQQVKERTASLVNAAPDSVQSTENVNDRLRIWEKTSKLVKDHPVIGVGPANWKLNILSYGSSGTSWSGGYYVPDRVHNVYLQLAAETGIPGAAIYIIFWLLVVVAGFKVLLKPADETQSVLVILLLAGLTAFATDSMFSFPTERIEHMLYVMLMAGTILGCFIANNKAGSQAKPLPQWLPGLFIFIALLNGIMGIKKHSFEKNLNYATAYENENRFQEMLGYINAGENSWVNVDQVGISLAAKSGIAYRGQKNYPKALEQFNLAMKYNPNSAMVHNNLGTVYTEMNDYKTAITYYEKALLLAPDFDIVKKNLAFNYYSIGNFKAAIRILEKVKIDGDEFLVNMLNDARTKAAAQP